MTRHNIRNLIAFAVLAAFADVSYAQYCVTSDGNSNTACGTQALPNDGSAFGNSVLGYYALYTDTTGADNTAIGTSTLGYNNANDNTGVGFNVLAFNTTGGANTATGSTSLFTNTTGSNNTAAGYQALYYNLAGNDNTAVGSNALQQNTASNNTAVGAFALTSNTSGIQNTSTGYNSLQNNTTGYGNTANGLDALNANTTGFYNAAFGAGALLVSQTASENAAMGTGSLYHDTTGYGNSAAGFIALFNNTTGIRNTAVGANAGTSLVTGNYNTYIGYGIAGGSGENYVTRIGVSTTDSNFSGTPITFISGIWATQPPGSYSAVVVNSNGQLGMVVSSERYKTDIASLGTRSEKLSQLRPVSFHLKSDPNGTVQYGLIAEEVDKVYPELVVRDNDGKIQGVRYDELAPMLLNEMQKQQRINAAQADQNNAQAAQIAMLEQQLAGIQAALVKLQPRDDLVAQR
jgi:hypothetical protein